VGKIGVKNEAEAVAAAVAEEEAEAAVLALQALGGVKEGEGTGEEMGGEVVKKQRKGSK